MKIIKVNEMKWNQKKVQNKSELQRKKSCSNYDIH